MSTRPTREAVYQAMFNLVLPLKKGPLDPLPTSDRPFVDVTREIIEPQRVPPASQPILMQYEFNEDYRKSGGSLIAKVWTVVYIIGITHPKGVVGAAILNPLIDAVESVFWSTSGEFVDLGFGESVRVVPAGPGGKDHGDNSTRENKQAIYYLPVEITLPLQG